MAFLKAIVSHRFHVLDILEFFQKNVLHQFFCVCQAQEKTDKQFIYDDTFICILTQLTGGEKVWR